MKLRPHGRLGSYELYSAIGEGGLGDVWKAHDTSSGRFVALRILPAPPPADPFRFARFDQDIRKLIALRHPNLSHVYELIEIDGVRALACEWVAGDSLASRIAAGPIPVDDVIRIIAQVANGLAAAHARDFVHGGVKPSNITLCGDGTVKVVDLGLVQIYEPSGVMPSSDVVPAPSARLLGAITGAAAYMSPEQIAGHAADSRADVWAFGCVLYEMLTGTSAFGADDAVDTMARVTSSEPEWALIPPGVPASLVQMLRRCLDRDVLWRFQRLTDVLAPIREASGRAGTQEASLRQTMLRRMSQTRIRPDWTDRPWPEIERVIPALRRWAHARLPRGSGLDTDAVIQAVVVQSARRLKGLERKSRAALAAYLRHAVLNRIRDETRRIGRIRHKVGGEPRSGLEDMAVRRALQRLTELLTKKKRG